MSEGNGGPEQGGGAMVKKPETPVAEPSPATPVAQLSSSSENPAGLVTTSASPSERESASQAPQQAQPGGLKDDPKTAMSNPEESSNKPINMMEILTQEFKLSEDQQKILKQKIPELKQQGIDLESFSEENLGDPATMRKILEIIGSKEMRLNEEQRKNLEKIEKTLRQAEQGEQLKEAQIQEEIDKRMKTLNERITELEEKENLTDEEQKELEKAKNDRQALQELQNIVQSNLTGENEHERVEGKRSALEQKIKTYGTYAAVGMGLLVFVFAWRGLKETGGRQGEGMRG